MAHMIDNSTGSDAIAFVGETPWHGLGRQLTPDADIEAWRIEAGLDYTVERTPVVFDVAGQSRTFDDRHVLYRSDTEAPLSVISKDYKIVQPAEVLDFFAKLAEIGGFQLETAGVLWGGQRIWGLAKVNEGAPIIGHDVVQPYVLLATSYDGSLSTTAKFTTIRVVCHNTLTMAVPRHEEEKGQQVRPMVKVPHNAIFRPEAVRQTLGIAADQFERWLINTRILADQGFSVDQADVFTQALCREAEPYKPAGFDYTKAKSYRRIMEIFSNTGAMIGGDLTQGQTRWRMLNAVTQFADYDKGRIADNRMQEAWFGNGDKMKSSAYEMLTSGKTFQSLKLAA